MQPNQLTVDNLTVEWLKEKLTELESTLQDNREKQVALQGPEIIGNGVCKNNNTGMTNGVNGIDRYIMLGITLLMQNYIYEVGKGLCAAITPNK